MWCVGIGVNTAVPERNGHQMGPGESTTNHIPGVAADRRETIPYQIIAPVSGRLSDPPLIKPAKPPACGSGSRA